jgi:hypothetical protein
MVIATRSNSQIFYPTLSPGAFTAARTIREPGRSAPEAAPSQPDPRGDPRRTLQPWHREGVRLLSAAPPTGCSSHALRGRETHRAGPR